MQHPMLNSNELPAAKRLRMSEDATSGAAELKTPMPPLASAATLGSTTPSMSTGVSLGVEGIIEGNIVPKPVDAEVPVGEQDQAGVKELIARKNEMLRNLQTAETMGYTAGNCPPGSTAPASMTTPATTGQDMSAPPAFVMPTFPKTMATSTAGLPPNSIPGQTMLTPGAALTAPAMPTPAQCPPGTSPEQYEAYRQQCWKQYFEWCSVWQKYNSQTQNDPKAMQGKNKGKGNINSALATPLIRGNVGPNVAQIGGLQPAPVNGQFAAAASLAAQAANLGKGRGSLVPAIDVRGRGQPMLMSPTPNGGGPALSKPMPAILAGRGRGINGSGSQVPGVQQPVRSLVEEDIHSKLLGL